MAHNMDQDELIAQFAGVASVPPHEARQYLAANNWDLPAALTEFYTSQEEDSGQGQEDSMGDYDETLEPEPLPGGGRRLGEGPSNPQPIPTTSSSGTSRSTKKSTAAQKKFATLGDFSGEPAPHDHDESSDEENQDFFAGGEKSGLAVQNPDDIKKKILEKAMKTSKPRPKEDSKPAVSHFTGSARTLGGDDTPSQTIEPPPAPRMPARAPRVDRILHFWNDGFSVDDGDLYRTDDPRNASILNGIREGRAPLSIMNVLPGQEVDVEIKQHAENYVKPKKKYVPFGGAGNRLGSPTPGVPTSPAPSTPSATQTTSREAAKVEVDDSQPTISLQVRLGNGSRVSSRFNTTHTVGDVYGFVAGASPDSQNREWVLMTTFPSRELTDKAQVLGDMPDFKRGGVVVQKWK